jgi:hypothetical protein
MRLDVMNLTNPFQNILSPQEWVLQEPLQTQGTVVYGTHAAALAEPVEPNATPDETPTGTPGRAGAGKSDESRPGKLELLQPENRDEDRTYDEDPTATGDFVGFDSRALTAKLTLMVLVIVLLGAPGREA